MKKSNESGKGNSKNRAGKQSEKLRGERAAEAITQLAEMKRGIMEVLAAAQRPLSEVEIEKRMEDAGFKTTPSQLRAALQTCCGERRIIDTLVMGETIGWEIRGSERKDVAMSREEIEKVIAKVVEGQRSLRTINLTAAGHIHLLTLCMDSARDNKGRDETYRFFDTIHDTAILDGISQASSGIAESIDRALEKTEDALDEANRLLRRLVGVFDGAAENGGAL